MAIQAESSGNYENVPVGIHNAVLTQVVDLGLMPNKFYDPNLKGSRPNNRQVVYVFQLESRKSDGTRFLKEFWFNLSSNEKSNIAKFLNGWFGRVLTDKELQLDHESLIGQPVQVIISVSKSGKNIITSAVTANPNNALQIEPYDVAEYARQLKERALKQEDAAMGGMQKPNQQYQQQSQYQQPAQNTGFPQQYQPPMQPQQIPAAPPIAPPNLPNQQMPTDDIIPF